MWNMYDMPCTRCSFEITCWSGELAKEIATNNQHRRHIGQRTCKTVRDKNAQNAYTEEESRKEDLSLVKQTNSPEGCFILQSTFYLLRTKPTTEDKEARNREDMSTENFGALMDSVRNRMETLVNYTIDEIKH